MGAPISCADCTSEIEPTSNYWQDCDLGGGERGDLCPECHTKRFVNKCTANTPASDDTDHPAK